MAALVMQSHSRGEEDGGCPLSAPRKNDGHMLQPDVGMTTRGPYHPPRDQDSDENTATNDDNKGCFSCSSPSAPLSSTCSMSSASGLSNSPLLSHSLASQAMTPLSLEGSDYIADGEPAVKKLGRLATPFDALAAPPTVDELVTLAPQNTPEEAEESVESASGKPPLAQPLDPLDTTAKSRQPQDLSPELRDGRRSDIQSDLSLPDETPASERGVSHKNLDDARASRLDEPANATLPDGTGRKRDIDHANGCARKCDDAPDASQRLVDATLMGICGQRHVQTLGGRQGPDLEKRPQQREQQRCRQTEPAITETEPRSGSSAPTLSECSEIQAERNRLCGPGIPPTSLTRSLGHGNSGANIHYPCIPEHDVPVDPSAKTQSTAAQDQKINNTNPISQNSSQTATASRDPVSPFSSSATPPPHPAFSSFPVSSSPVSTDQSAHGQEESVPPLVRTTSDNSSLRIQHPIPDINPKTGALLGNIAQLEATAERLSSTTASIEDAIRDLHAELKRSDSQRSAAARARAGIESSYHEARDTGFTSHLRRPASIKHSSASATLARRRTHSGRTAAVKQPSRYRPRSSSLNTAMQSNMATDPHMSRTGPGKGSIRSVRTGKQSLAEISESEPISLTQAAFDEADRSNLADGDDDTIRPHTGHDKTPKRESFIPTTDAFHAMMSSGGHTANSELFFDHPEPPAMQYLSVDDQRPVTSASNASSSHMNNAFRDFDGVHCDPETNFLPPSPQPLPQPDGQCQVLPRALRSESPPKPHPTSYLDEETGKEMLFYPARVPAMLSLPPKLSKKPKAAARNQRQSHVLSTMPEIARRSGAAWLPDPLAGNTEPPFLSPLSLGTDDSFRTVINQSPGPEDHVPQTTVHDEIDALGLNRGTPEVHVTHTPAEAVDDDEVKPAVPRPRKDDTINADARKSRISKYNSNLPPQARASAFFDLPSNSTKLEVKDGSATATLDHLLDASTQAPVSAFTDHLIAGKLGSEVYGAEKRRSPAPKPQRSQPDLKEADAKKRGSVFHRAKKSEDLRSESGTSGLAENDTLPPGAIGYATLSPGSDESDDSDKRDGEETLDGEEEDNEEYHGPPTTLLAELQIRKQQQKNRTRPINQAFPNGIHSTLLQLDAVAEEQRKTRKGKRVNLAWEDPDPIAADAQSDDEDVPLGVLFAAKASGTNDMNAASAEFNRPLGLMEKREMEENEPLSQRRARLQGQDPGRKRQTLMPASATRMSANRLSQMPSLAGLTVYQRSASPGTAEQDEEGEGETLGERMRRLKKKEEEELPKTRPVSTAFSAELLGQFADPEEEKEDKEDENGAKDGEEEETLGQRRRRLQAEREGQSQQPAGHETSASLSNPSKRLSMANILSAHPKRDATLQEEERRRGQEDRRIQRMQGEKLAAMRSQMPTSLEKPSVGAAAGGFGNGRFNDGTGGTGRRVSRVLDVPGADLNRSSVVFGGGMIQQAGVSTMMGSGGQYVGAYGAPQQHNGAAGQYNAGMAPAGWYPQMQVPMGMPAQPQMPMPIPMQMQMPMGMGMPNQGHSDPIERWRHSVMP